MDVNAWASGAYQFAFKRSKEGVGVLTVTGSRLPLPYHMIINSLRKARAMTSSIVSQFDAGGVPEEGVFRAALLKARRDGTIDVVRRVRLIMRFPER